MVQHRERSFFQTYGDSIWHAQQARASASPSIAAEKHTRASIMASAISLEAAANCTLSIAPVDSSLTAELDKLTPMGKFEIAAKMLQKKFDRGDSKAAAMADLIKLRNDYVHPKERSIPISMDRVTEGETVVQVEFSMEGSRLQNLGIDRHSKFWFPNDAVIVLQKCTAFYNWYFLDCLQLGAAEILGTLGPLMKIDDKDPAWHVLHQECIVDEVGMLKSLGVKNKFLDFDAIRGVTVPRADNSNA